MKLSILSDLHIEFEPFEPPGSQADVIILAGDIHVGKRGLEWARIKFPEKPVIYVLGNHEYYGQALPKHLEKLREQAAGTNIHVLENESLVIGGIVFIGCTLWTDFGLFGNPWLGSLEASDKMNDFRKIRVSPTYRRLHPQDTVALHKKSILWLAKESEKHSEKKKVIVTHHAPSRRSVPGYLENDSLTPSFASNLDESVKTSGAVLWAHGHIHSSSNYAIGPTRVVCNPKGYPDQINSDFSANYLVEI